MEEERNTQYDHQHGGESQEKAADQQVEVKERGLFDTLLGRNKLEGDQGKKLQEEALVTGMDNVKVSEPQKHEVNKNEHHGVEEKKKSLLAKLHRTGSSSSSSSSDDEEEEVIDDNGEVVKRKKKKKGLKEKIKEKLPGHKDHCVKEGEHKPHAPPVPTHVVHHHQEAEQHKQPYVPTPPAPAHTYVHQQEPASVETTHAYKEHEDDHHHKTSSSYIPAPAPVVVVQNQKVEETPTPEKGLLDKIKEKLPGGHKKAEVDAAAPHTATEDVSSPDGKEKKQGLLGKIMDKIPGYNKSPAEEEHKPATATGEHKKTSS